MTNRALRPRALFADTRGATAVEFSIIVSLLLLITFGIIDFALAWWQWNTAEAAAEIGVRYAVESDPAAEGFNASLGWDAVLDGSYVPGQILYTNDPSSGDPVLPAFSVTCTNTQCTCSPTANCPANAVTNNPGTFTTLDSNAFNAILARIQEVDPNIQATNLVLKYSHIGLGIAGRPGINIVPAVTVQLTGLTYNLTLLSVFGFYTISMPDFQTTLIAEDLCSGSPDATACE